MHFETKFAVGDQVYTIEGHEVKTATIVELYISMRKEDSTPNIYYSIIVDDKKNTIPAEEKYLFATKEELISSL